MIFPGMDPDYYEKPKKKGYNSKVFWGFVVIIIALGFAIAVYLLLPR